MADRPEDIVPDGRKAPLPGEIWRHYKGNDYLVLHRARMEHDGQWMVVYVTFGKLHDETSRWVRPLSEWVNIVEHEGERVQRFTFVKKAGYYLTD